MLTEHYSLVLRKKQEAHTVRKQCKMCGKVTIFTDTTIRRHNANGKTIYQYAIYKCPKNHAWNKKLDSYKSFSGHVDPARLVATEFKPIPVGEKLSLCFSNAISYELNIAAVEGIFRLDRALAEYIEDWSRTEIVQKIKAGKILLNNAAVKPSQKLFVHDKVLIVVD